MKLLVILSFDVPDDKPEIVPDILQRIDAPALPFFAREIRLAADPVASLVVEWLDSDED